MQNQFDPIKVASALRRMLATMPLPSSTSNPDEAIRVYFEVCKPFYTGDILDAVEDFISGSVEGVNQAFAPSAAQLAARVRAGQNKRANYNQLENSARQQLLERDKHEEFEKFKTPEAVAAVRELVNNFVASVDEKKKPKKAEEAERELVRLRKLDALFADQFGEYNGIKISSTLAKQFGVKLSPPDNADEDGDMGGSL